MNRGRNDVKKLEERTGHKSSLKFGKRTFETVDVEHPHIAKNRGVKNGRLTRERAYRKGADCRRAPKKRKASRARKPSRQTTAKARETKA